MGVFIYWSPSLSYASWVPAAAGAGGCGRSAQTLYPRSKESRGYPQPVGATAQGSKAFRLSWTSQRVSRPHVAHGSAYSEKLNQDPPAPKTTFRCLTTTTYPVRTEKKIPLSAELHLYPYRRTLATGSTFSALLSLPHVGPCSERTLTLPPRHPSEGTPQAPNVDPPLYLLAILLVRPRLGDLLVSQAMRPLLVLRGTAGAVSALLCHSDSPTLCTAFRGGVGADS